MSRSAYLKDRGLEEFAEVLKLLAEPSRLQMIYSMGLECRPVAAIIEATAMTQTNVSFHLRALREAGLVRGERRGAFVYYCVSDPLLLRILDDLKAWVEERDRSGVQA